VVESHAARESRYGHPCLTVLTAARKAVNYKKQTLNESYAVGLQVLSAANMNVVPCCT
jgi:hypothetical protein